MLVLVLMLMVVGNSSVEELLLYIRKYSTVWLLCSTLDIYSTVDTKYISFRVTLNANLVESRRVFTLSSDE